MKRRLFLAGIGVCTMSDAQAGTADDIAGIQRQLADVTVLHGRFTQEKQVRGFRNPLRSQGRFVLARNRGVIWITEQPFASEVVITPTQIRTRQADGSQRVEVDSTLQPGLRVVNALLFSVLSGDLQALMEHFSVQSSAVDNAGWQLSLTPKPGPLARVLAQVSVAGDAYVRQVRIGEQNGDQTSITFSDPEPGGAGLTPDEAVRFD